ncbi:MAG: hypothetical protein ACK559_36500, partial [bacterium]
YLCEVISVAISDGILTNQRYLMMTCDNLTDNGYFCREKLPRGDVILSFIPLATLSDVFLQTDGGNIKFMVKNCRVPRQVVFYFLRPDFTNVLVGEDLNNAGTENK